MSVKWNFIFSQKAEKDFSKLDYPIKKQILRFFEEKIQTSNPRLFGKPLAGNLSDFWSYRVGNYRIICKIEDEACVVVAVTIGHRRYVYSERP